MKKLFLVLIVLLMSGCTLFTNIDDERAVNYCKVHTYRASDHYNSDYEIEEYIGVRGHTLKIYDSNEDLVKTYSGEFTLECTYWEGS